MIPVYEPKTAGEVLANIKASREKMAANERARKLEMAQEEARRIHAEAEARQAKLDRAREIQIQRQLIIAEQIREVSKVAQFTPWLIERCRELGVSHHDILSKKRVYVEIRHQLIREAHERFPLFTLPALGKRFNRDHSSIHFALYGKPKREGA